MLKYHLFFKNSSCHQQCVTPQTHTQTVRLSPEGAALAGCPRWLSAVCSGGTGAMNERSGKLPVSGDRCAEVELQARPIMPPDIHSFKKKRHLGKREDRGLAPPNQLGSPPTLHAMDSTDVTSCLCHRADCIVVSSYLWLFAFPAPSLCPSLLSPPP